MEYSFNWQNPDEWQNDGALSFDETNGVLFFDTAKETAVCSKIIEIPDNANCFEFCFEAVNGSPVTRDSDSGRVRLSFLDENNTEISGFEAHIVGKEYFHKYTASSAVSPVPIPPKADKLCIEAEGTNRGKSDLNFYFKNFTLDFYKEEHTYAKTDYTAVFAEKRIGDRLIRIGDDSVITTVALWALLGIIAATGVFKILKRLKSENK